MKGIILAGGKGTRLRPLTHILNKNLLPVYDRPMILYGIETMKRSGVTDIMIVIGKNHSESFMKFLGTGEQYGVSLSYAVQEGFGGSGEALEQAENFARGEKVAVLFADNFFENCFVENVQAFEKSSDGARIFLKEVPDPHRFGIAEVKDDKVISFEEKPKEPKSNLAAAGFYLYDETLFDKLKNVKPSIGGERFAADVHNDYLADGKLYWSPVPGFWSDMGTFDSLHETAAWIVERRALEEK